MGGFGFSRTSTDLHCVCIITLPLCFTVPMEKETQGDKVSPSATTGVFVGGSEAV